ncbi:MAG: hypothetical protein O9264_11440 [Leptospira sp.]|nr:hypothetical protein [Leptospira sp.]
MKRHLYFLFPLLLIFGMFFRTIETKNLIVSDAMVKLIQAKSIIHFQVLEPEFFYLAKSIDPKYQWNPYFHWLNEVKGNVRAPFPTALNLITAILLVIFDNPNVTYYTSVIFATFTFYLCYRKFGLKYYFALLLCTSVVLHSLLFLDVSICLFLIVLGMNRFFETDKPLSTIESILYALLLVIVFSIRPEYFTFFSLAFLIWILLHKTEDWRFIKENQIFLTFSLLFLLVFFLYNYHHFGHPLGMRYLSNRVGILNQIDDRLSIISSLLFFNKVRLGFFGFMPIFLIVFILCLLSWKHLPKKEKFYFYLILIFFIILAFLSPNDSWIDWGTRYLTPAIFPFLSLYFYFERNTQKKGLKIALNVILILTLFLNLLLFKLLSSNVKSNKKYVDFVSSSTSELNVIRDELIIAYTGDLYFKKAVILSKNTADEIEIGKKINESKIQTVSIYSFLPREKQNITNSCYEKFAETTYELVRKEEFAFKCQ